jgi:predicted Rdx family selenoprotein
MIREHDGDALVPSNAETRQTIRDARGPCIDLGKRDRALLKKTVDALGNLPSSSV